MTKGLIFEVNPPFYFKSVSSDFEYKMIIEIDGRIHQQQQEYDQERQADLEAIGYKVIRFTNEDVIGNWEGVEKELLSFYPHPVQRTHKP
ncbi:MAG: DUF559 domain-containing protein [Saprospiraceae bacterium]|nr:DUF559 domain-containing protein [Saprospiraceae bacterium]